MILPVLVLALPQPATEPPRNGPPPAAQPPAPKLANGKYAIVKVSGDINTDLFTRQIAAELDRAKDNALIILELDGNRARFDLVAGLGQRIATNTPPVAVLLKDSRDKRVGVGQALLGGFVKACFIDPDTHIASAAGDDLGYLAPPDTARESINQELTGALWRKLTDLHADQTLPPLLLSPQRDTWAVPITAVDPWKLSSSAPAGGQSGPQPRQIAWKDGGRIDIDADTAVALRLCAGEARSMAPLLIASNLSPRSTSPKRTIESSFASATQTIARTLDDAKLAVRRISTTLTLKSTDRTLTGEDYRRAGQSALDQIARAAAELDRAESLLADYPELSRRPGAPSKGDSAADKGPHRPVIDSLRKDLDKHRTTARDFSSR